MRTGKRLLTGTLALLLAATALPTAAFAASAEQESLVIEGASLLAEYTEQTEPAVLAETNEELLQHYIDEALFPEQSARISLMDSGASANLSGVNLKLYQKLRSGIEQVAAGTRNESSFTFSLEDLGFSNKFYSAKQLGVSAIVKNGAITQAAADALVTTLKLDPQKVVNALLADCPYDLYWYDKTVGYIVDGLSVSAIYDSAANEYLIKFASGIRFYFSVAEEYYGGSYKVSRTSAVNKAIQNIQSVVNRHAAEDDLTKLQSYRAEICNQVDYNHAVSLSSTYGNPWQLIWVFDNDASTKVVCEGYAKAFQYLCDLSTFQDAGIQCRIVSGVMDGGTGAGPHMWNVVTMNDAKNYLVDVTNCDSGSIGEADLLFLAGLAPSANMKNAADSYAIPLGFADVYYQYDEETLSLYAASKLKIAQGMYVLHTHSLKKMEREEPGYSADGHIAHWACTGCGRLFSDDAATQELTASQIRLPKLVKMKNTSITVTASAAYTGKALTPAVTVKDGTKTLKKDTDYTVTYSNNKKIGMATVKITGKNNYIGTVKKTFQIVPKGTSVSGLKAAKRAFTASWKKQSSQTAGYEIQYCTKKSFSSGAKTVRIKNAKTVSRKIKKLKAKTTYYVRVRTYQKVGTKRYYSAWSKIKKVKTR